MEITVKRTITEKVKLSTQKADVVYAEINKLFEEMVKNDYREYAKLLEKLAPFVVGCAKGHGVWKITEEKS